MVKKINAKKGFADYILYIIIMAIVIVAIVVIFWMSQTGALNYMAAQISSILSISSP